MLKNKTSVAEKKPYEIVTSIRGIDPELFQEAHIAAIRVGQSLGYWMNQAILAKLNKKRRSNL
jgi:hypothetical protein